MNVLDQHLLYRKDGAIARIILNRPEALNAFSLPMIKNWALALEDAQQDAEIRVIVLTATGKAFCAGGDTKTMLAGKGFIAEDVKGEAWGSKALDRKRSLTHYIHKIALTLESMDNPVICGIQGVAVGAGLDMALMCDLRIIAESAKLSAGYVMAGLVPGDGGAYFNVYSAQRTNDLRTALDLISSHMAIVTELEDHCEALVAMAEKREPKFQGI